MERSAVILFALVLLAMLLAGCAVAPDNTSLTHIAKTLRHLDHPEYLRDDGRPLSPAGKIALDRDWDECWRVAEARVRDARNYNVQRQSAGEDWDDTRKHHWGCLWEKGWRWEATY